MRSFSREGQHRKREVTFTREPSWGPSYCCIYLQKVFSGCDKCVALTMGMSIKRNGSKSKTKSAATKYSEMHLHQSSTFCFNSLLHTFSSSCAPLFDSIFPFFLDFFSVCFSIELKNCAVLSWSLGQRVNREKGTFRRTLTHTCPIV